MSEKRNKKGQFDKGHVNSEELRKKHSQNFLGNTYNSKIEKFPEECKKAFEEYCEWLSKGHSIESFCYKSDKMTLTYKTIEKYIREFPEEFPPSQKEAALTQSLKVWEERGLSMMLGQIEKCQPAIFQMFMRNKFGWDREQNNNKNSGEILVAELLKRLDNQPKEEKND